MSTTVNTDETICGEGGVHPPLGASASPSVTEVVLQGTGVAREGTDDEHAREREKKSGENPRRHQAHE